MQVLYKNRPKPEGDDGGENKQNTLFHQLVECLQEIREEKFTGYIKINYSQGSIGRVERFEEILRK